MHQRSLHQLSHVVSLEKFSSSHRNFLVSLDSIPIPTTLSEDYRAKIGKKLYMQKWRP